MYDAGRPDPSDAADTRTVSWDTLSWEALTPAGTTVSFQVATSADAEPSSWDFVGPDGTSGTVFTSSPASLPPVLDGSGRNRHVRYRALLGGNGQATPTVTGVWLSYSGTTSSRRLLYGYDGSGNMVSRSVETSSGTDREVRDDASWPSADRINALNQVMRNDVTPAGGSTTTWRYAYDLGGNLVSRTDGTRTWSYSWDEDDRLVQVTLPGGVTVAYAYDMAGRMLRRTHSVAGTTTFAWDGWDCVREVSPDQVVTRWGTPQGELLWFERGGSRYEVHSDTLGSVRLVTGSDGAALARFDHDAWGNELPSTFDHVPGGMPYRFVGALGVRWDADTGMHYMRHRWYDPGLGRFISRDPLGASGGYSLYEYVNNAPTQNIDPLGLYAILVITRPDGTRCLPRSEVKNPRQAAGFGLPESTSVPIRVPAEVNPQAMVDLWRQKRRHAETISHPPGSPYSLPGPTLRLFTDFKDYWGDKNHDWKNYDQKFVLNNASVYDAFGNFMYGATGTAGGLAGLRTVANYLHDWQNHPVNRADIESGISAISTGCTLSKVESSCASKIPWCN